MAEVTGNKWFTATEPSHLNGSLNHSGTNHWDWTESFKRLNHSGTNHSHVAQRCKTSLWLFVIIFCRRNGAKTGNMVSKTLVSYIYIYIYAFSRMYLNINLFIKLLYKINSTFVIMLILKKKRHSSCDFNYVKRKYMHFLPHILNFAITLNAF